MNLLLLLLPLAFALNANDPSARETVCLVADAPAAGLRGSASEEWSLTLSGGERAYILVEGSGASDLDASLLDASGTVVVADEGLADFCLLTVTPASTGLYTLRVTNRGRHGNVYDIRVETPEACLLNRILAWLGVHFQKQQHVESYRARLQAQAALLFIPGPPHLEAVEALVELLAHQPSAPKPSKPSAKTFAIEEEFASCPLSATGSCPVSYE